MKHEQMTNALHEAAKATGAVGVTECQLADACYAFLEVIERHGNFLVKIACRWIHGRISAWKRGEGCP